MFVYVKENDYRMLWYEVGRIAKASPDSYPPEGLIRLTNRKLKPDSSTPTPKKSEVPQL